MVCVDHYIPGRTRVRLTPWLSGTVVTQAQARAHARGRPIANPHSQAVLIEHDAVLTAANICAGYRAWLGGALRGFRQRRLLDTQSNETATDDEIAEASTATLPDLLAALVAGTAGLIGQATKSIGANRPLSCAGHPDPERPVSGIHAFLTSILRVRASDLVSLPSVMLSTPSLNSALMASGSTSDGSGICRAKEP